MLNRATDNPRGTRRPTALTHYFREGDNYTGTSTPYAGTRDTEIRDDAATTPQDGGNDIVWDTSPNRWGLLAFDSIFGDMAEGKIPLGSTIISAVVHAFFNDTQNTPPDVGTCHYALTDWVEATATWNNTGSVSGTNYNATKTSDLPYVDPAHQDTYADFDVTADIAAWCAGSRTNRGWYLIPHSTSGTGFRSSEFATQNQRPQLIVTFIPAVLITLGSPVLTFTGFNTATLTLALSRAPGDGTFTPSGMTMHAAGRSWDFSSASATVTGTTLTITGIVGTVVDAHYSSVQDLFTYSGADTTHLPNVQGVSNVAVTFTGGALVTATGNAALNTTSQLCTQSLTATPGTFVTATDSYFTAWLSNQKYQFVGFVCAEGSKLLITACGSASGESHANELRYDGKNTAIVDSGGRPVMPFTTTVAAMSAGAYPTRAISGPNVINTSSVREWSGIEYDAANDIFWAISDDGFLFKLLSNGTETTVAGGGASFNIGGDVEAVALVDSRPDYVYILVEGGSGARGQIKEYRISTNAVTATFSFPVNMPTGGNGAGDGNAGDGDEGLAFINQSSDSNVEGRFVVSHQKTGDLYYLTPTFGAGSNPSSDHTLTYVGTTTLSFGSNDACSLDGGDDDTLWVFFDDLGIGVRIWLPGLIGQSIDTNSPHIVESTSGLNINAGDEAFCIASVRSGSGVRETHRYILGQDATSGSHMYEYTGKPMAVYPLLT